MVAITRLTVLLGAAATAFAAPLEPRAVINHDAVVGFPESVPEGLTGELYLKYKPWLKVFTGCVPFPAVNAAGDTGGGLKTTGSPSSGCSSSTGQVYARQGTHNGQHAIMYSWYMPKDSPSHGLGHRHDWESAVVWLSSASADASILGVAGSAHGGYEAHTTSDVSFDGTRPKLGYRHFWPVNHQIVFTGDQGGQQPLIAYESLTDAARRALDETNFGSANVPFNSYNFARNLERAAL
ncbi:necrosis inducing protein-domain-containing protein [Plectosphaerella plurivora]|uniref:Necrosis inducing protein-domain-containing protein n=1 Tax=Plectosphaerella plurivora TaxID=936078 RepID=A0A9P8V4Q3_9PEZI|nr:necrosis inducing protein-domain-containing protein [Plectosphaerella plurivora]